MEEKKTYTAEEALNLQSAAYQKGYNEGYQLCKSERPNTTWVKATRENMRRSAILRDPVCPGNHIHQWVINGWDEKGVKFTNRVEKEWWELEILDESPAAGREEDAEFQVWRDNDYLPVYKSVQYWVPRFPGSSIDDCILTTAQLYELFKQQKEK